MKIYDELNDWYNASDVGSRFTPSEFTCPKCGGKALRDEWPPNYWSSVGAGGRTETSGNVKCVCMHCKVQFRVYESRITDITGPSTYEATYTEPEPLFQLDGVWMTNHDMWRETYKVDHGVYPREAYG